MNSHLLIVDNEAGLSRRARDLRKAGFGVSVVRHGEAALARARAELPSLILVDAALPKISGLVVCRILKEIRETQDIPVVLVAARPNEVDRAVALKLGAADYLSTPLTTPELLAHVRFRLGKAVVGKVSSPTEPSPV